MVAMNISLTPELAKIIRDKVKSGLYSNASEVVREAVRKLNSSSEAEQYEQKLSDLKRELEMGVGQIMRGEVVDVSYSDIMARLDAGE